MKISNLSLLKVSFDVNEKFNSDKKEDSFNPQIGIDFIVMKRSKELLMLLGVKVTEGNVPYYFEIRAGASFKFDKLPPDNMMEQLAHINCPAIIFPYIRETIADLTRRSGFTPLHLDPINFIELNKKKVAKKKVAKKKVASK